MNIPIQSPEDIHTAAKTLLAATPDGRVYAFYGSLGAGKTTFIRALCEELGVTDVVTSPTFAIINEYRSAWTDELIYHFDFYRLRQPDEVYDLGCEEYFDSGSFCFIEWPESVEALLPENVIRITLEEQADGSRLLVV